MNSETYDEAIRKAQQEFDRIKALAEQLIPEFKQAIPPYLTAIVNYEVSNAVTKNPDIIISLSPAKLSELKKSIAEVITAYPAEINRRIENIPWLQPTTMNMLDHEIRIMIGQVGALLITYGLAKLGSKWDTKNHPVHYAHPFPNHADIDASRFSDLQKRYATILQNLDKANQILKQAKLDKTTAKSEDIWKNA
jgi:hypothetical protein